MVVPKQGVNDAVTRLHKVVETLATVPDTSRRGFLGIAEQMGHISGAFATAASRATSIRERIDSPDRFGLTPLRADLRRIAREISGSLDAVGSLLERKNALSRELGEIIRWGLRLEQDAFLPSIADQIHTRGSDMLEVKTLASIVDNLMQQLRPLIHEVVTASQEADDALDHLARRVGADLEASSHGQQMVKKATTNAQRRLGRSVEHIGQACQGVEERSQSVNRIVFEMVQAMQYDDITVQRLEHAIEALRRAATHLGDDRSGRGQRWFVVALRIVIDQLEETTTDLVTAVQTIHHHLIAISDTAEEQASSISGLRATAINLRQDTTDIAYHLASFLNLSIFNESLASEVLRTLSRAENAVFQTKRAINLLSLTAARLATLAGSLQSQGGERIEILASAIRELADRIQKEAPGKLEEAGTCLGNLEEINDTFSQKVTPRLMRTNSLLRRAPFTTQQIDASNTDLHGVMHHTLSDTRAMAVQIMLLAAELGFHMGVKRTVDQVVDKLQQLLHEVGGREALDMDRASVQTLAAEFDDLMELYTMDSERRIHNATLAGGEEEGNGNGEDELDFELF